MAGVRLDHVAIAAERMADAVPFLAGTLGGTPAFGLRSKSYRFGQWRFANGARIEVLEPARPDSFLHRFLARRSPAIHHVTFKVPSLAAACERAEAHGYDIVGRDESEPAWKEAFLHPKQALGIVVQVAEASVPAGGPRTPWEPPARAAEPAPPAAVLGLRLRADSAERARLQWDVVLGADTVEDHGDRLVFRWTRSPLRIAVDIDPTGEAGPGVIEYAGVARPAPPDDPGFARLFAPAG
jgi:methylmalonyl-CoA/ethylmalonyl-CoA epimerase